MTLPLQAGIPYNYVQKGHDMNVADIRKTIDERGFYLLGTLGQVNDNVELQEVSKELERLGYEKFYIAEDFKRFVIFAQHKTSTDAAVDWYNSRTLTNNLVDEVFRRGETSGTVKPFNVGGTVLDVDALRISIVDSYRFDQTNPHWVEEASHNEFFIQNTENVFTEVLKARGHLFLNDILTYLGFTLNQAGQLMGWAEGDQVLIQRTWMNGEVLTLRFPTAKYILDTLEA